MTRWEKVQGCGRVIRFLAGPVLAVLLVYGGLAAVGVLVAQALAQEAGTPNCSEPRPQETAAGDAWDLTCAAPAHTHFDGQTGCVWIRGSNKQEFFGNAYRHYADYHSLAALALPVNVENGWTAADGSTVTSRQFRYSSAQNWRAAQVYVQEKQVQSHDAYVRLFNGQVNQFRQRLRLYWTPERHPRIFLPVQHSRNPPFIPDGPDHHGRDYTYLPAGDANVQNLVRMAWHPRGRSLCYHPLYIAPPPAPAQPPAAE